MSGIAVAYGKPQRNEVDSMMRVMAHRGPDASGVFQRKGTVMAQNYLQADGARPGAAIPVRSPNNPDLVICYDGQMGNWAELASEHEVADGPFREEHLILALYEKYGRGMLDYLGDTIFALVIFDGRDILAARDLLGIKTLFYAERNGTLFFASELKGILAVSEAVYEFPNGHAMDTSGHLASFAKLPKKPPHPRDLSPEQMTADIRSIIEQSFANRVDFGLPTGGLLSGGLDSSVINYIASQEYKRKKGKDAKLPTFALGVGESSDILSARLAARHIDSEHHELIVSLSDMLEALPKVIYHLESFDPSLVRSSVANYLISRYAREQGIEILLSGEGGDEVFCGYRYLADHPAQALFSEQIACIGRLHNNASLRLDRMNMANSIRVVAPLISGELLNYALAIAPDYKQMPDGDEKIEKWIFRKAYQNHLPQSIVWRRKQEFSQGSGSADVLTAYFEEQIPDRELAEAQAREPLVRSKEELHYFRLFTGYFGTGRHAVSTVGQWLCL
jgi:asparagine synthase (glutamine-hydrolysing)